MSRTLHAIPLDVATAGAAVTASWWTQTLNDVLHEAALVGAVVLLALRIGLAVRALRRGGDDGKGGA